MIDLEALLQICFPFWDEFSHPFVITREFMYLLIYFFICLRVCYDVSSQKTCRNVQVTKPVSFVTFSTRDQIR